MIGTGRINSVFVRYDFPKLKKNDVMVGQSATIANDNLAPQKGSKNFQKFTSTSLTLAPIWFPHWPACKWTISRILRDRKQRNSQGEKQLRTDFWKIYFETEKLFVGDKTDRCSRHKHPRALSKQWHLIGWIDVEVNYSLITGIIITLFVSHAIFNGEKCAFLRNLRAEFEITFAVILCKTSFNEYNWSGKFIYFYLIGQVEVDN